MRMEEVALSLWLVMLRAEWSESQRRGWISTGSGSYIGLRERMEDAWEWMTAILQGTGHREDYVLVHVRFTRLGFLDYSLPTTRMEKNFAQVLRRVVYEQDTTNHDWGVWHFHGDLPLLQPRLVSCVLHGGGS